MKKSILFIAILFLPNLLVAQSIVRLNNDWNKTYMINPGTINSQYYINPGSVASQYLLEFNMAARQQWVGFPGSPTTLFASGTLYQDEYYTQFGLKVLQDKIGYTSTTDIDLTYAYSTRLNLNWRLNMGLGLSFQALSYDVSQVKSPTASDPTILTRLMNEDYINSDLGLEFVENRWRIGFSSQNIFSLFSPSQKLFPNSNFLYVKYKDFNHEYFNLGYGVCGIQYANIMQMEFNLTGYFKANADTNPFQIGLIYRMWGEAGLLFGFNLTPGLRASYSYDYNLSGISRGSYGSHELMVTYKLYKSYRCKNCWY